MVRVLAAFADKVILDAIEKLKPIALIAVVFGIVYWLIRRHMTARKTAKRKAWLNERREKRGSEKKGPNVR